MRENKNSVYKILEGLVSEGPKHLGDDDVVDIDYVRAGIMIEDKLISKYEKVLSDIGYEPALEVDIGLSDEYEDIGIPTALDSISLHIYFERLNMDVNSAIKSLKKILKKYAWAGIRYSKKDDGFFIETVGKFDSYELLDTLKSDGINVERFYEIIPGNKIRDYRMEDYGMEY